MADGDLIFSLIRFIHETCKQDGTEYPAEILYALVMNLQGHLHMLGKEVKFLKENKFKGVQNTLDNHMKAFFKEGYGSAQKLS